MESFTDDPVKKSKKIEPQTFIFLAYHWNFSTLVYIAAVLPSFNDFNICSRWLIENLMSLEGLELILKINKSYYRRHNVPKRWVCCLISKLPSSIIYSDKCQAQAYKAIEITPHSSYN